MQFTKLGEMRRWFHGSRKEIHGFPRVDDLGWMNRRFGFIRHSGAEIPRGGSWKMPEPYRGIPEENQWRNLALVEVAMGRRNARAQFFPPCIRFKEPCW
jgi:hypothetical protein